MARKFRDEIFNLYRTRKVLHGDLHHENILLDNDIWKFIDPHGVIGFPINEICAFVNDIEEDIPFIANYFDFAIEDIKKCYLMHTVIAATWAAEDNMKPQFWLDLATKMKAKY